MNTSTASKSITLACQTVATVTAFNGRAQGYVHDVIEAEAEKQPAPQGWQENLFREVVRIGDKVPSADALLAMREGSRLRLFVEARRLTYGDKVDLVAVACPKCNTKASHTIDLSRIVDVPYTVKSHTFTAAEGCTVTIGWGTGITSRDFLKQRKKTNADGTRSGYWNFTDEALVRVQAINGEAVGPRWFQDHNVNLLEEIRRVGNAMVPRLLLDGTVADVSDIPGMADVPVGGITERVEVECDSCGATFFTGYAGATDFLMRGAAEAVR